MYLFYVDNPVSDGLIEEESTTKLILYSLCAATVKSEPFGRIWYQSGAEKLSHFKCDQLLVRTCLTDQFANECYDGKTTPENVPQTGTVRKNFR